MCIVAVGNELKGDDGVGILAGKILKKRGFRVIFAYETPVNVLEKLKNCDRIIVVDAAEFEGERPYVITRKLDRISFTHRVGFEQIAKFVGKEVLVVGVKVYRRGFGKISEGTKKNVEKAVRVVEVCMAEPAVVVDEKNGVVLVHGEEKKVKIGVPGVKKGDFVLVHAGVVVDKISREEYEEIKRELEAVEKGEL